MLVSLLTSSLVAIQRAVSKDEPSDEVSLKPVRGIEYSARLSSFDPQEALAGHGDHARIWGDVQKMMRKAGLEFDLQNFILKKNSRSWKVAELDTKMRAYEKAAGSDSLLTREEAKKSGLDFDLVKSEIEALYRPLADQFQIWKRELKFRPSLDAARVYTEGRYIQDQHAAVAYLHPRHWGKTLHNVLGSIGAGLKNLVAEKPIPLMQGDQGAFQQAQENYQAQNQALDVLQSTIAAAAQLGKDWVERGDIEPALAELDPRHAEALAALPIRELHAGLRQEDPKAVVQFLYDFVKRELPHCLRGGGGNTRDRDFYNWTGVRPNLYFARSVLKMLINQAMTQDEAYNESMAHRARVLLHQFNGENGGLSQSVWAWLQGESAPAWSAETCEELPGHMANLALSFAAVGSAGRARQVISNLGSGLRARGASAGLGRWSLPLGRALPVLQRISARLPHPLRWLGRSFEGLGEGLGNLGGSYSAWLQSVLPGSLQVQSLALGLAVESVWALPGLRSLQPFLTLRRGVGLYFAHSVFETLAFVPEGAADGNGFRYNPKNSAIDLWLKAWLDPTQSRLADSLAKSDSAYPSLEKYLQSVSIHLQEKLGRSLSREDLISATSLENAGPHSPFYYLVTEIEGYYALAIVNVDARSMELHLGQGVPPPFEEWSLLPTEEFSEMPDACALQSALRLEKNQIKECRDPDQGDDRGVESVDRGLNALWWGAAAVPAYRGLSTYFATLRRLNPAQFQAISRVFSWSMPLYFGLRAAEGAAQGIDAGLSLLFDENHFLRQRQDPIALLLLTGGVVVSRHPLVRQFVARRLASRVGLTGLGARAIPIVGWAWLGGDALDLGVEYLVGGYETRVRQRMMEKLEARTWWKYGFEGTDVFLFPLALRIGAAWAWPNIHQSHYLGHDDQVIQGIRVGDLRQEVEEEDRQRSVQLKMLMAGIWPLLSDDYFLLEPNPPFSEQEEEAIVALQNHSLEEVRASLGIEASTRWEQLRKSALKLKFESAAQNLLEIEQPYNDWAREIFNASGEILEDQEKRLEAYLALSQNPTN